MDIAELVPSLSGSGWKAWLRDCLHNLLGIYTVHKIFSKAESVQKHGGKNVFLNVLQEMNMPWDIGDFFQRIPSSGPVVVVSNHPFGGADAIALSGLCADARPDTQVLANAMSSDLPGTAQWTIPLHIMGEDGATGMNRHAMKASLDHLRAGGVLVVFPAGAVSRWRNDLGRIADPEWSPHIMRLATKTGASVLPVRFFGKSPLWFELLGNIHPMLRSAMIVRAFLTMKGQTIRLRAGDLLEIQEIHAEKSAEELTQFVRGVVESLEYPI